MFQKMDLFPSIGEGNKAETYSNSETLRFLPI
jgi:hypothetical protein